MIDGQKDVKMISSRAAEVNLPFGNEPALPPPAGLKADPKTGEIIEKGNVEEKKVEQPKTNVAPAQVPTPPTKEIEKAPPASPFMKLLNTKKNALQNFLGDEERALRFMSAVMHCMDKIPDLGKCSHDSLMGAFMECAALGLYPGTASGDCYVLPYAGKAQFQIGYRGLKTLAFRSGILSCGSDIVYENDYYKEYRGTDPRIVHNEAENGDRGKPIRVYTWAEVTPGRKVMKSMTEAQVMKIKELSQAKNSKYSPWNSNTDPELWMWRKTCFKQMSKLLPTSEKLDRAFYADSVSERGGYYADEAHLIEIPFDNSEGNFDSAKDKKQALRNKKK